MSLRIQKIDNTLNAGDSLRFGATKINEAIDRINTCLGIFTFSELRNLDSSTFENNEIAIIRGGMTVQDGDAGIFYADKNDTSSQDDGKDVIVAHDGTRWKRLIQRVTDEMLPQVQSGKTFTSNTQVQGDLVVDGDFEIGGSIDYVHENNLQVEDKIITINKGGTNNSAEGAGVIIERPAGNESILWNNTEGFIISDDLKATKTLHAQGNIYAGSDVILTQPGDSVNNPVRADRTLAFSTDDALEVSSGAPVNLTQDRVWSFSALNHSETQRGVITPDTQTIYGNKTFNDYTVFTGDVSSPGAISRILGWQGDAKGNWDFRSIFADSLVVKAFTADVAQAFRGSRFLTKSFATIDQDFIIPNVSDSATLTVRDVEGFEGLEVFEQNDYVLLNIINQSGGGLIVGEAWGEVTSGITDNGDGTQSLTLTMRHLSVPELAGLSANEGSEALSFGSTSAPKGFIHDTVLDNLGSPYSQVITWENNPWDRQNWTVRTRQGNLEGISNADGYGYYGNRTYLTDYLLVGDLTKQGQYLEWNEDSFTIKTGSGNLDDVLGDHGSGISANSDAINTITSDLLDLENTVISYSSVLTFLNSSIKNNELGIAGNATAISSLDTRVTDNEGNITSIANAITSVESDLADINSGLSAVASGLDSLETETSIIDGKVTTNAQSIQGIETAINDPSTGLDALSQSIITLDSQVDDRIATATADFLTSSQISTQISDAVSGLATETYVGDAVAGLATETYVGSQIATATANFLTSSQIQGEITDAVTGLATETYVNNATADLATETYVNDQISTATINLVTSSEMDTQIGNAIDGVTVDITANADAISSLDTRVTNNEGGISNNATAITNIETDLYDSVTGLSAVASGLSTLQTTVTAIDGEVDALTQDVTNLQSGLSDVESGVSGNADAISSLTTRVSDNEGGISSNASSITSIQSDLSDIDGDVIANAEGLSQITTNVMDLENTVSAYSSVLTFIDSSVKNNEGDIIGNATAISSLDTRVDANESGVSTNATAITNIEADVYNSTTGLSAVASGLSSLETTVSDLDGEVSSNATSIQGVQSAINDENTGLQALSDATLTLETQVGDLNQSTATLQTAVTNAQGDIDSAELRLTAVENLGSTATLIANNFDFQADNDYWRTDDGSFQFGGTSGIRKSGTGPVQIGSNVEFDSGVTLSWANIGNDKPESLAELDASADTKLSGIEANADVTNYADSRISNNSITLSNLRGTIIENNMIQTGLLDTDYIYSVNANITGALTVKSPSEDRGVVISYNEPIPASVDALGSQQSVTNPPNPNNTNGTASEYRFSKDNHLYEIYSGATAVQYDNEGIEYSFDLMITFGDRDLLPVGHVVLQGRIGTGAWTDISSIAFNGPELQGNWKSFKIADSTYDYDETRLKFRWQNIVDNDSVYFWIRDISLQQYETKTVINNKGIFVRNSPSFYTKLGAGGGSMSYSSVGAGSGGGAGSAFWGSIGGNLSDQTDIKNALDNKSDVGHNHTELAGPSNYIAGGNQKPSFFGGSKVRAQMLSGSNIGVSDNWNDVFWISSYQGGDVKKNTALILGKSSDFVGFSKQDYDASSWGTVREFWHTGNFDPSSKANAQHSHTSADLPSNIMYSRGLSMDANTALSDGLYASYGADAVNFGDKYAPVLVANRNSNTFQIQFGRSAIMHRMVPNGWKTVWDDNNLSNPVEDGSSPSFNDLSSNTLNVGVNSSTKRDVSITGNYETDAGSGTVGGTVTVSGGDVYDSGNSFDLSGGDLNLLGGYATTGRSGSLDSINYRSYSGGNINIYAGGIKLGGNDHRQIRDYGEIRFGRRTADNSNNVSNDVFAKFSDDGSFIVNTSLKVNLFEPNTIRGMGGEFLFNSTSTVSNTYTTGDQLKINVNDLVFNPGDWIVVSGTNNGNYYNIRTKVDNTTNDGKTLITYESDYVGGSFSDIQEGFTVVKIDGHSVYVNSNESKTAGPYIDGYQNAGHSDGPFGDKSALKFRLGYLGGAPNIGGVVPSGTGLYSTNAYLKGTIVGGENADYILDEDGYRLRADQPGVNKIRWINGSLVDGNQNANLIMDIYGYTHSTDGNVGVIRVQSSTGVHDSRLQLTAGEIQMNGSMVDIHPNTIMRGKVDILHTLDCGVRTTSTASAGRLRLPVYNDSTRPSNPMVGEIIFNTDANGIQIGHNGGVWGGI